MNFQEFLSRKNEDTHTELRGIKKKLTMKKEIQNNYNNIYLLFFIIEVVNIAENMNLSESYVEENRNHSSCVCYIICFNSS